MKTQPNPDRQAKAGAQVKAPMAIGEWIQLGALTAVVSMVAVVLVQFLAISAWPEIALFKPLDSYPRTVLFTLVPVIGATALLAWLVARRAQPLRTFITISLIVLAVSIVPDYLLPVPHKSLLASSVTALLHVVAGLVTVGMLVTGYQRRAGTARTG